jgi:hypothetical protein
VLRFPQLQRWSVRTEPRRDAILTNELAGRCSRTAANEAYLRAIEMRAAAEMGAVDEINLVD